MNNSRTVLGIALLFISFLLWQAWVQDHQAPAPVSKSSSSSADTSVPVQEDSVPAAADVPSVVREQSQQEAPVNTQDVFTIETDVIKADISLMGGSITHVELLDYPVKANSPEEKLVLLDTSGDTFFIAQSGLLSSQTELPNHKSTFQLSSQQTSLDENGELRVVLNWQSGNGLSVEKTYLFRKSSYQVSLSEKVFNETGERITASAYQQLQRNNPVVDRSFSLTNPQQYSFTGGAYYSPEDKFEKMDFDEFYEEPLKQEIQGGWIAMLQHYFLAAWVPPAETSYSFTTHRVNAATPRYIIRSVSPAVEVAAASSTEFEHQLVLGPKLQNRLAEIAPGLELTSDYGVFAVISKPLFWALDMIHTLVGNWGWAIVILTVAIKLAFFKLTEAQYRSMARMRKMQPKINALKERFGEDKQKFNEAMMNLYRTEKVNPLGGCLPLLVQIPVFIALYWVLLESVELRQAPFILWLQDLSSPDPYFVLPIVNGIAMILTQRLSPQPMADPMQQKIMQFLPVMFAFMFAFFQSGLVLYWTLNSVLSLAQQWVITKRIEAMD